MKEKGYTVIELMIVVGLVSVLAAYGIPSFLGLIKSNRLTSATNDFITAIHYAKSESGRSGRFAYVQAITSSAANEWGSGWRVWVDQDSDNVMDAGELVREFGGLIDVTMDETGGVNVFSFNSLGVPRNGVSLTVNVCDDRAGETGRSITMTALGVTEVNRVFACS